MPTHITIIGRATADAELRFSPGGKAVANLNVAVNHRKKEGGEWVDDGADFYRVDCWEQLAENVAETITKGTDVIIVGTLRSREWEDRDGNKRTSWEIRADNIGPALRYATATVTKAGGQRPQQSSGGQRDPWVDQSQQRPEPRQQARSQQPARQADPYGGQSLASHEEPPF